MSFIVQERSSKKKREINGIYLENKRGILKRISEKQ